MKSILPMLVVLLIMSCTKENLDLPKGSSPKLWELKQGTPVAVVEGNSVSNDIYSYVLHDANGLRIVSKETGDALSGYDIVSFEVVYIPYKGDARIEKNSESIFKNNLISIIQNSKAGDRLIFRSIKVKSENGEISTLDDIILSVGSNFGCPRF